MHREFFRVARAAIGSALLCTAAASPMIHASPVLAQDRPTAAPTREELQRLLRQRDDAIAGLVRRVEELERRLSGTPAKGAAPTAAPERPETAAEEAAPGETPPAAQPAPQQAQRPAGPGAVTVDQATAERALERSLVTTGVVLLPPGTVEISPNFSYTRTDTDSPALALQDGVPVAVANLRLRRNILDAGIDLRAGLPFDSQIELGLPSYTYVDQSTATLIGGGGQGRTSEHGSGVGDFTVGLAKTLLTEKAWGADLVGRVTWNTGTGEKNDDEVSIGNGFQSLSGQLTASKSLDPLVFVGSAFYERSFTEDHFRPGEQTGYSLSVFLAASPETSLRFGFSQAFVDEARSRGDDIKGSDFSSISFDLGASVIVGRRTLLDVSGSIGLNEDTPDYVIRVSLPIQFDLPFRF
ncbi:transporter [Benzoatithermus flavus]|uniref:Transporter n=1 Tax=Benzoatithermus flavus TaxID=3108223 RepID=A0ABU8XP12_9PROT